MLTFPPGLPSGNACGSSSPRWKTMTMSLLMRDKDPREPTAVSSDMPGGFEPHRLLHRLRGYPVEYDVGGWYIFRIETRSGGLHYLLYQVIEELGAGTRL